MKSICGALPLICSWPLLAMRESGSGVTPMLPTSRRAPATCSAAPGVTVPTPTWPVVWSMNSRGLPSPSVMPRPARAVAGLRGSARGLSARPKAGLASLKLRYRFSSFFWLLSSPSACRLSGSPGGLARPSSRWFSAAPISSSKLLAVGTAFLTK